MENGALAEFVARALDAGVPHESLAAVLAQNGWPERDIYDALGAHYERLTGSTIPRRRGGRASAREAFLYLLVFSTLGTWSVAFSFLSFALIDTWQLDPLFFEPATITTSLAAVLVAFPLFLLVSWIVARESASDPERLTSPVRKWLTYIALVIAVSVFMSDLITLLAYLLRGEVTSRFIAKAAIVLALSSGIFAYYFDGLRRADRRVLRDRYAAWMSATAVAVLLIFSFRALGSPRVQREVRQDSLVVQNLYLMSNSIDQYRNSHAGQLPRSLSDVPGTIPDPSQAAYEYHPQGTHEYQLCATFARNRRYARQEYGADFWSHPSGHHCFLLEAGVSAPFVTPE